jgi:hypothetical protein
MNKSLSICVLLLLSTFCLAEDKKPKPKPLSLEVGQKFIYNVTPVDSTTIIGKVEVTISSITSNNFVVVSEKVTKIDLGNRFSSTQMLKFPLRERGFVDKVTNKLPGRCHKVVYEVSGYAVPCLEVIMPSGAVFWVTIDGNDAVFPGHIYEKHLKVKVELVKIIMPSKKKKKVRKF